MDNLYDDISSKQKEFVESLDKAANRYSLEQKDEFKKNNPEVFHLNYLITKNYFSFYKRSKL